MKRIVSLLLAAMMCLSLFTVTSAKEVKDLKDEQIVLLKAMGFYNESATLTANVTRGEFAYYLVNSIYENAQYLIGDERFIDVTEEHPYFAEITLLKHLKVSVGDENGNYNPDSEITSDEAITLAVRFLGYELYAQRKGYAVVAAEKNLYKGLSLLNGQPVSLRDALVLVCNVLNADVADQYLVNNYIYTFMQEYRKLYKIEGIVSDDGTICSTGMSKNGKANVSIDGVKFKNATNEKLFFGSRVIGYYNTKDSVPELVAVQTSSKSTSFSIEGKDIINFDPYTFTYEYYEDEEHDSKDTITISSKAQIVYNGVPVTAEDSEFTVDKYIPFDGNVIVYDNDGDNEIDMLYISAYTTIIVSALDHKDSVIYSKYDDTKIDLRGKEYTIEDKDGRLYSFADIGKNDVLTIAESLNKKVYTIYLSKIKVSEAFKAIEKEEGKFHTRTGGTFELTDSYINYVAKEYQIVDGKKDFVVNTIKLNKVYSLYLDVFHRIAYAVITDPWEIAYVINAGVEGRTQLNKEAVMTIYNKDLGISSLKLAENVYISDQDGNPEKKMSDKEAAEVINTFCKNNTNYNRLLRYQLNGYDEVSKIELPLKMGIVPESREVERLSIIIDSTKNNQEYTIFNGSVNGQFIVKNAKNVIVPPAVITSEVEDYGTTNYETYFSGSEPKAKMIAYTVNPYELSADYIVVTDAEENKVPFNNSVMVVTAIKQKYDSEKEERYYQIDASTHVSNKGVYADTFFVAEEDIEAVVTNVKCADGKERTLSPGDIIRYTLSKKNNDSKYITKVQMIYDADEVNGNYGEKGRLIGSTGYGATRQDGNPIQYSIQADTISNGELQRGSVTASIPSDSTLNSYNAMTFSIGYLYDNSDDRYIYTTQPLKAQAFDYSKNFYVNPLAEYISEAVMQGKFAYAGIAVNISASGKVTASEMSDKYEKSYLSYGADCTKVIWIRFRSGTWGFFYN